MISILGNYFKKRYDSQGKGTRQFFKNLSIISLSFFISKIFSTVASIVSARFFGGDIFGEIFTVTVVNNFLMIAMLLGINNAVIRFGAPKENPAKEVATAFYLGLCYLVFATACVFFFQDFLLARLPSMSKNMFHWGIAMACTMAFYTLLTSATQAAHNFKLRGLSEIWLGVLLLPAFYVGFLVFGAHYSSLIAAFIFCYSACAAGILWKMRKSFSPSLLPSEETGRMIRYGLLSTLGGISYIMAFIVQPFQIKFYGASTGDMGTYRVYHMASLQNAAFFATIIQTVYFPKISASKNKTLIWKKVLSGWIKVFIPSFLFFAVVTWLSVMLSGKTEYGLDWIRIMVFATASVLLMIMNSFLQLVYAQGQWGMCIGIILSGISGAVTFGFTKLLTPQYGITGAVCALIISFSVTIIFAYLSKPIVYKSELERFG